MPDSAKPALQDSPRVVTPRRDATRPAATIQRGEQGCFPHHLSNLLSFHTEFPAQDRIKAGRAVGALNRRHRYEARTSSACSGRRQ